MAISQFFLPGQQGRGEVMDKPAIAAGGYQAL